ncbi:MAG: hypothetical protein AAGE52_15100 [Myxococcota bacterium]
MKRRSMLRFLFGAGGVGLTAAATGLPVTFLRTGRARADERGARFLVMMSNSAGDPFNCNTPGTYDDDFVWHPSGSDYEPIDLQVGDSVVRAARLWERLPLEMRQNTAFLHHATRSQLHSELAKVLRLHGKTRGGFSVAEIIAQHNAPVLDTLQPNPLPLGDKDTLEVNGAPTPRLSPQSLKSLLVSDADDVLASFADLRSRELDRINAILREHGNTEQRRLLDAMALSRQEAAALGDAAGELLSSITDDGPVSQMRAAIALIRLRVAPVMSVNLPFGGDNHGDPNLDREGEEYRVGIDAIRVLFEEAAAAGLADQIAFATLSIFGRSLRRFNNGRTHHPVHSTMMLYAPGIRGGVFGGVADDGRHGFLRAYDSRTGVPAEDGDVTIETSLPSVGKTLACAAGVPLAEVDEAITEGTVIAGAL